LKAKPTAGGREQDRTQGYERGVEAAEDAGATGSPGPVQPAPDQRSQQPAEAQHRRHQKEEDQQPPAELDGALQDAP